MRADDAVGGVDRPGPAPQARQEAERFLAELLADGQPMLADDVEKEVKAAGLSIATVRRAKQMLGVRSVKCPYRKQWTWVMPKGGDDDAE